MRVYISMDMEGVAGIVHVDQVRPSGQDYGLGRELMTLEANSAAQGSFDAGASEVLINDSHGDMRNLLLERLDSRAQIITGSLKPFGMVQGIHDAEFDVAMFVGYHSRAGTQAANLDHTYWGKVVAHLKINGCLMNEAGLNALVAGEAGTPVGLVCGDATTCDQCRELLGEVDVVPVKWAISRYSAKALHPEESRRRIRAGAAKAVAEIARFKPFRIPPPYTLEIRMHDSAMADSAAIMPGVERIDARTLQYRTDSLTTLFNAMQVLLQLGGGGIASVRSK